MGAGPNKISKGIYDDAIGLYSTTDMSIKEICAQLNISSNGFISYLSRNHRDLILKRHSLSGTEDVKLRGGKGQTTIAYNKYKDAIEACRDDKYISYNISQIARMFNVGCSSLATQLRRHYPHIIEERERKRKKAGLSLGLKYGAREKSKKIYAKAVSMLRSSNMTIEEVAVACKVSYTGLREHIITYHPNITSRREKKRSLAVGQKIRGARNGNWTKHEPNSQTVQKYAQALELYNTTALSVVEITKKTNVRYAGFRNYLRTWHPELIVQRRGYSKDIGLNVTKRYSKSTAQKYAEAIQLLVSSQQSINKIAKILGLNAAPMRMYIKEHYPNLIKKKR